MVTHLGRLLSLTALGCALSLGASCKTSSRPSGSPGSSDAQESSAISGSAFSPTTSPELVKKYDALADDILETRKREVAIVRKILNATYEEANAARARALQALKGGNDKGARAAIEDLSTLVGHLALEGDASVARVRKRLVEGGHHFNPILAGAGSPGDAHHGKAEGHHGQPGAPDAKAHPKAGGPEPQTGKAAEGIATPPSEGTPASKDAAGHASDPAHHAKEGGHGAHHAGGDPKLGYDPGFVCVPRGAKKDLLDASRAIAQLSATPSAEGIEREWAKVQAIWATLEGGKE